MSVCSICGKSFIPYYELSSSKEITVGGRTYPICHKCGEKYKDDTELKNILLHSRRNITVQNGSRVNHTGMV